MSADPPTPTELRPIPHGELDRWSRIYASPDYVYGEEPGPVARRAVRYHRPFMAAGGTALDVGCGEGQDLAFLSERGYAATGVELTPAGVEKSRRLLRQRALSGNVIQQDARYLDEAPTYDLVLAVNSIQFFGSDAPQALDRVTRLVSPGGVIGISLFAREKHQSAVSGTIWFAELEEVMELFRDWQCLEAAKLWQWNVSTNEPQPFITLIARRVAPPGIVRLQLP